MIRMSFHDWYYHPDAHGMFLASASKQAYIELMNALDTALFEISPNGDTKLRDRADSSLSAEESHRLLELSSHLRHQLATEIGAANPPHITSRSPARTVSPLSPVPSELPVTIADAAGTAG
jgi:hypothetical protein